MFLFSGEPCLQDHSCISYSLFLALLIHFALLYRQVFLRVSKPVFDSTFQDHPLSPLILLEHQCAYFVLILTSSLLYLSWSFLKQVAVLLAFDLLDVP